VLRLQLSLQIRGNLLAVKASIFDEDFIGAGAGDDHACDIDSTNIAFQRYWIADRAMLLLRQLDAHAAQKIVVRMIADQREHEVVLQTQRSARGDEDDVVEAKLQQ